MRGSLGEKIGEGAMADIHAWAPGQVLKLFKAAVPRRVGEHEARMTRAVFAAGGPAPEVLDEVTLEGRFGMVLPRLDGPTLLQLLLTRALAKKHKATLVIAKLDRLSRNMAFTATLMDAGVDFVAVDNPHASRLTLHILAAVAEHEREMIDVRTRDALAAAKARGTVLGAHGRVLAEQRKAEALDRLTGVSDRLRALKAEGLTIRAIAERLNAEGLVSPAGGAWQSGNVHRALSRLGAVRCDF